MSNHPADVMGGLFVRWEASGSAILQRVREMIPTEPRWILAVADLGGVVVSSAITYVDPQPLTALAERPSAGVQARHRRGDELRRSGGSFTNVRGTRLVVRSLCRLGLVGRGSL